MPYCKVSVGYKAYQQIFNRQNQCNINTHCMCRLFLKQQKFKNGSGKLTVLQTVSKSKLKYSG